MTADHEMHARLILRAERISSAIRDKYQRERRAQRQLGWLIFIAAIGFIACLLAPAAHARELVYMPNKAGGEIVLTDTKMDACPSGTHIALSRTREGDTMVGCWAYSAPYVYVKWSDGEVSMFKATDFIPFDRRQRGKELGA